MDELIDNHKLNTPGVPARTKLLTKYGYTQISDLAGQEVQVWNGYGWSTVIPISVGTQLTVIVHLDNGSRLECCAQHAFNIANASYPRPYNFIKVCAKDLKSGDQLVRYDLPVVSDGKNFNDERQSYSQGFYSGCNKPESPYKLDIHYYAYYTTLYPSHEISENRIIGNIINYGSTRIWTHGRMERKYLVPVGGDLSNCVNWLSGIFDALGKVNVDEYGHNVEIPNTNKKFLSKIRLMLTRLGICARILVVDGTPVPDEYMGPGIIWKLVISNWDVNKLIKLGLSTLLKIEDSPNTVYPKLMGPKVIATRTGNMCENFSFDTFDDGLATFNGIVTFCGTNK